MFGGADPFGGGSVSPLKPKGVKKMADQHRGGGLFEEEEGDLFASKPKLAVKPAVCDTTNLSVSFLVSVRLNSYRCSFGLKFFKISFTTRKF